MSYKIIVDSCCELPEELGQDKRLERVPLGLEVGEYCRMDDETFDKSEFLRKMSQMSQILLSFSGTVPGKLCRFGRACVCRDAFLSFKRQL